LHTNSATIQYVSLQIYEFYYILEFLYRVLLELHGILTHLVKSAGC